MLLQGDKIKGKRAHHHGQDIIGPGDSSHTEDLLQDEWQKGCSYGITTVVKEHTKGRRRSGSPGLFPVYLVNYIVALVCYSNGKTHHARHRPIKLVSILIIHVSCRNKRHL